MQFQIAVVNSGKVLNDENSIINHVSSMFQIRNLRII